MEKEQQTKKLGVIVHALDGLSYQEANQMLWNAQAILEQACRVELPKSIDQQIEAAVSKDAQSLFEASPSLTA